MSLAAGGAVALEREGAREEATTNGNGGDGGDGDDATPATTTEATQDKPVAAGVEIVSPLAARGLVDSLVPYSPEEIAELEELGVTVKRFEEEAAEFRAATRTLIEYKYKQKRDALYGSYERLIVKLEVQQRDRRDAAIAKFEAFVRRYPDDDFYSPDAMFRLSELYFERSYETYFNARQVFDVAIDAWNPDAVEPEPTEPVFHYEPTIAMMQRLIVEFPRYRLVDGAYYLLGYCLGEQGEEERAVDVYEEMVSESPASRFSPEVWTRIGEYYFNANELERAMHAYNQVLGHVDTPFYDKALYKLAWTHYRLADPERSPDEFQKAVDTFVTLLDFNVRTLEEGKERGRDLRSESIQYIAISYAEEGWGGTDMMLGFIDGRDEKPYNREILTALGDVYFDQTRFIEAIRVYGVVQERYPDDPQSPQVQEKIITSHERDRNFEAAAEARGTLTRLFSDHTDWWNKNRDNERALEDARKLTEKSLYTAALFHHKQAQIHKEAKKIDLASQAYGRAAEAYSKYLERFPHDKQLYELTFYFAECLYYSLQFEPAATQYEKVRDSTSENKFLEDSAFSTFLSYEHAVQVAEKRNDLPPMKVTTSSERDPEAKIEPREIPPLRIKLIDATDRFAALIPTNTELPKLLYKAAEVFYAYDHFEEARKRFTALLEKYPGEEVAEYASNLIIESHLAENDFHSVEKFTAGLLERPAASQKREFRSELVKFRSGAMFKIADELAEKNEHEKAAALYVELVDVNPETEFADLAINNAAVQYEKVSRFDSASKLYERLGSQYPKSTLADNALFRVALNAERFFDFEKAIRNYEKLARMYPKSSKRADAIYNTALSLDNVQEYERSAKEYLRYCKLFPTREDAPAVCFRAGTVYEKMDDPKRVISTYQSFIKKYRKNADHQDRIIEANLRIAKSYETLNKEREAKKYYTTVVKEFARTKDQKSAPYAAEARFQLVDRQFADFQKIQFVGKAKKQQKTLTKKAEVLKKVETAYKEILGFKQIGWTLASLYRIGQLYQEFADSLISAECPPDVKKAARRMGLTAAEVCDEYRFLLEDKAANLEDKAVAAYETTVERAREFQVVNEWTKRTLVQLNKLRRKLWPLQKDAKFYLDPSAVASPRPIDATGKTWEPPEPEPEPEPAAAPAPAADQPAAARDAPPPPSGSSPPAAQPLAPAAEPLPAPGGATSPPPPPGQPAPEPLADSAPPPPPPPAPVQPPAGSASPPPPPVQPSQPPTGIAPPPPGQAPPPPSPGG